MLDAFETVIRIKKEQRQSLNEILEKSGLESVDVLLNAAITIFNWALNARSEGRVVASVDEDKDTYRVMEMPGYFEYPWDTILTEQEYEDALKRVEELMDAEPNSPEEDELANLAMKIEGYEKVHFPIEKPDGFDDYHGDVPMSQLE